MSLEICDLSRCEAYCLHEPLCGGPPLERLLLMMTSGALVDGTAPLSLLTSQGSWGSPTSRSALFSQPHPGSIVTLIPLGCQDDVLLFAFFFFFFLVLPFENRLQNQIFQVEIGCVIVEASHPRQHCVSFVSTCSRFAATPSSINPLPNGKT